MEINHSYQQKILNIEKKYCDLLEKNNKIVKELELKQNNNNN